MKELQIKTNINCSGYAARAAPVRNTTEGICGWSTANPNKVLPLKTGSSLRQEVVAAIENAGKAEANHTTTY